MPSMVNIGPVDSPPHMGEVVGYWFFSSNIWLSGTRTADAGRSTPTYCISIDAVAPKMCFMGVSTLRIIFGELFPKNSLIFWPEKGFLA